MNKLFPILALLCFNLMLSFLIIGCQTKSEKKVVNDECNIPELIGELEDQLKSLYSVDLYQENLENIYSFDFHSYPSTCEYNSFNQTTLPSTKFGKVDYYYKSITLESVNSIVSYRGDCMFNALSVIEGKIKGFTRSQTRRHVECRDIPGSLSKTYYVVENDQYIYSDGEFMEQEPQAE